MKRMGTMPEDLSQTAGSVAAVHDLVVALERLFTIGSFYPRTHVRCRDVAEKLKARIDHVRGGGLSVRIDIGGQGLTVNSTPTPAASPNARRVYRLLYSLGIGNVEIDASATRDDLLDFAVRILRDKLRLDSSQTPLHLDFADLPQAVRVARREFGARVGAVPIAGAPPAGDAGVRVLKALDHLSLTAQAREGCRRLVHTVLGTVAARSVDLHGGPALLTPGPERKLDDVLEVAANTLQSAITEMVASGEDPSDPEAVAARVELTLHATDDPDAASAVLDAVRRAAHESNAPAAEGGTEIAGVDIAGADISGAEIAAVDHTRSRAELLAALSAYRADDPSAGAQTDRSEYLGILLQMLARHPAPALLGRIQSELKGAVAGRLTGSEKAALIGGLASLLSKSDLPLLDKILPLLIAERREARANAAAELLIELASDASTEAGEALWPHLANELLRGLDPLSPRTAGALQGLVVAQPREVIHRHLPRLIDLDALASGSFDRKLAAPPTPELAPLFEELLHTSRETTIGTAMLAGFQKQPPAWTGSEIFAAIPVYGRNHRTLLALALRAEAEGRPTRELLERVGLHLDQALSELSADEARKPWVPGAIVALGELRGENAEPLLVAVLRARRFFFLPLWPPACRRAARQALREVQARKAPPPGPVIGQPTTAPAGEGM